MYCFRLYGSKACIRPKAGWLVVGGLGDSVYVAASLPISLSYHLLNSNLTLLIAYRYQSTPGVLIHLNVGLGLDLPPSATPIVLSIPPSTPGSPPSIRVRKKRAEGREVCAESAWGKVLPFQAYGVGREAGVGKGMKTGGKEKGKDK